MAGRVIEITEDNFEQEVAKSQVPVLVDMWAAWCGPCRMIAPVVEELAESYAGKIKMGKLNVDDHPQIAGRFRVMNIPTLLLFKDGSEVDRIVGVVPKEELSSRLEQVVA
ncbi:MAG TPA: thioredoxin [bacterium]